VGGENGWRYWADTGMFSPFDLSGAPGDKTFAFAPGYPSDARLLVGSSDTEVGSQAPATVTLCTAGSCGPQAVLTGTVGTPTVVVAPSFSRTGLVVAWRNNQIYRSTDGGRTFVRITSPSSAFMTTVGIGPDDTVYAALAGSREGGVFISHDLGVTWSRVGTKVLGTSVAAVAVLGQGRILAAPASPSSGIFCSADDGRTWARLCPAV
jgi:hypothetical protein